MLELSDSHRQLLKAMLSYEIQNYVEIKLATQPEIGRDIQEYDRLMAAKQYLQDRIKELSA